MAYTRFLQHWASHQRLVRQTPPDKTERSLAVPVISRLALAFGVGLFLPVVQPLIQMHGARAGTSRSLASVFPIQRFVQPVARPFSLKGWGSVVDRAALAAHGQGNPRVYICAPLGLYRRGLPISSPPPLFCLPSLCGVHGRCQTLPFRYARESSDYGGCLILILIL